MCSCYSQIILCLAVNLIFSWKRLQRYLKFFQQEEYDNKRFINWYFANTTFDKKISLFCVLLLGVNLVYPLSLVVAAISFSLYALWLVFSEKKMLVFSFRRYSISRTALRTRSAPNVPIWKARVTIASRL